MNVYKFISIVLFFMTLGLPVYSQDSPVVPKRTPEQEASKQTDKLQQELDLSQDQAKEVYKINLRYARERQISNKRSEAMERMKNKNADIQQVLSPEQNSRLQSKRYERTYLETNTLNQGQQQNPTIHRSTSYPGSYLPNRTPASSGKNNQSNNRPVNPNFYPGTQQDRPVRRSTTVAPQTNRFQNNPLPSGSSTGVPIQHNSSSLRNQSLPANTPGRNETPVNSNRK